MATRYIVKGRIFTEDSDGLSFVNEVALNSETTGGGPTTHEASVTLAHTLPQAEVGNWEADAGTTLETTHYDVGPVTDWDANAIATLNVSSGLNQFPGSAYMRSVTMGTMHFGPQGEVIGVELNPDPGFDTPVDWETGQVP